MTRKIRILTVVGARPQIIKAAAISRAIKNSFSNSIEEIILHTGQHYDEKMSRIFFEELEIPLPAVNLGTGNTANAEQLSSMVSGISKIIAEKKTDLVLVYGDTNSTLAGALAAAKASVPLVHIEAGLRSFNKTMPEEINRVLTDHVSTLLFSPTKKGVDNLAEEGIKENTSGPFSIDKPGVFHCGDVMLDNSLFFSGKTENDRGILVKRGLKANEFVLATVHRNFNADSPERLNSIFSALNKISKQEKIIIFFPLHPRTAASLERSLTKSLFTEIKENEFFKLAEPVSYLEMLTLEKSCRLVITDSGGLQKEAYFFKKPCIVLRPETEWVELVACGAAILADADEKKIIDAFTRLKHFSIQNFQNFYGDGQAAEFICRVIKDNFKA
jgi:UDP-GlcNAc3NAcA epimerase